MHDDDRGAMILALALALAVLLVGTVAPIIAIAYPITTPRNIKVRAVVIPLPMPRPLPAPFVGDPVPYLTTWPPPRQEVPPVKRKRSSIEPSALLAFARANVGKSAGQLRLPPSLWCADFINMVMRALGLPGTGSRMARSFVEHRAFVNVKTPVPGDVVVVARGRGNVYGHTAIFGGFCGRGGVRMVGGNQRGNRVSDDCIHGYRVVGYARPRIVL